MAYEEYKVIPQAIQNMADEIGMPVTRVADLVPIITKDILRTWHSSGENKDLDKKVEQAWRDIFKFDYTDVSDDITPSYIKGPPGQGKTTIFKVALENISKAMGVKLFIDPDLYDEPGPNDIVAVIPQLGGAISTSITQGIPSSENGMTVYNPPSRIKKMINQDLSLFLLDDLDNANDGVKNSAMPIVQSKRLNDINLGERCYVGVTGNLGAIDGTNTGRDSAALLNRATVRLASDTLGDWLERGEKRYNDSIGMAFIDEYLINNPESFYPAVEKKYRGQRPTSRSWDALTNGVRNILAEHDAQVQAGLTPEPVMPKLNNLIPSHVGKKVGEELEIFYSNVITLARPAAMQLLETGDLTEEMRQKLQTVFSEKMDTSSEAISRGFLRLVSNAVVNQLKDLSRFEPVTEEEKKDVGRKMFDCMHKYCKACFTTALVRGNKVNLVAQTTFEMMERLVDHSEMYGRRQENGGCSPSPLLMTLLTKSAERYGADYPHGEALTNLTPGSKTTTTAMQTAFIDPLTYTDTLETMQRQAATMT